MLTTDIDKPESDTAILRADGIVKHFTSSGGAFERKSAPIHAIDDVSLSLQPHETLGLVGESGCGKSTMGRIMTRLIPPTSGKIVYQGQDVTGWSRRQLRAFRRQVQVVFQDPYASLNPRATVREIVAEPLRVHGMYRNGGARRVTDLLDRVGLKPEYASRYPHEFSGGQRQRIVIARALALNPELLLLDEPVSALDVSVQSQVLNLLQQLQADLGLTYIFISHDLAVVRHISNQVAVMYLGKIVERGSRAQIYSNPLHPYTQALLSSAPVGDPADRGTRERLSVAGELPNPANPPSGCRFRTRCWKATELCATKEPPLVDSGGGHMHACHYPESRDVFGSTKQRSLVIDKTATTSDDTEGQA